MYFAQVSDRVNCPQHFWSLALSCFPWNHTSTEYSFIWICKTNNQLYQWTYGIKLINIHAKPPAIQICALGQKSKETIGCKPINQVFYAGVKSLAPEDKSGYIIINNDKQISRWIYVIKYSISGIKITSHHAHQQSITLLHLLDCNQLQFVDEGANIPCQYQITLSA